MLFCILPSSPGRSDFLHLVKTLLFDDLVPLLYFSKSLSKPAYGR